MYTSNDSSIIIETEGPRTFCELFWRKVREELHMDILLEKRPKKSLKLYPIAEEDLHIDLQSVTQWSIQNARLFAQLAENGYADFICNREAVREAYEEILFDQQKIKAIDVELLQFTSLRLLRLNENLIEKVENLPKQLRELHAFNNRIERISPKIKAENLLFLGLGHNRLSDLSLNSIATSFPQVVCIDLCHNLLCEIDVVAEQLQSLKALKMLSLYGNPISLLSNYREALLREFPQLHYFDEVKVYHEENNSIVGSSSAHQTILSGKKSAQSTSGFANLQKAPIKEDTNALAAAAAAAKKAAAAAIQQNVSAEIAASPERDGGNGAPFELPEGLQKSTQEFQLQLRIATLENNPEGILLDKTLYAEKFDSRPRAFQTCYWVSFDALQGQLAFDGRERPTLYENLYRDPLQEDKSRLDLQVEILKTLQIGIETRDFIRDGLIVRLHRSDPVLVPVTENSDTSDKLPKLDAEGFPITSERVVGVVRVTTEHWLRLTEAPREIAKKYRIFDESVLKIPQFHVPFADEAQLLVKHKDFVAQVVKKREDELARAAQEAEQAAATANAGNKKGGKGGAAGAAAKKKDDKKTGKDAKKKGGKDAAVNEAEEKGVENLDWPLDTRDKLFVSEKNVQLCLKDLTLAIQVAIV